MDRARCRLRTMPRTERSSTTARDTYQRSAARLTVAERIAPPSLVRTLPSRGRETEAGWSWMLPVGRKASRRPLPRRNRGNPTRWPSLRPRQKLRQARSRSRGAF